METGFFVKVDLFLTYFLTQKNLVFFYTKISA